MPRKTAPLLPATHELLVRLGERLRAARLRRRLSAKQVAERAGMAPMTLRSLERGGSGVTIGAYLSVMQVLGIEQDLDHLAQADPMGRALQDARLPQPRRATRRPWALVMERPPSSELDMSPTVPPKPRQAANTGHDWIDKGQFASSTALSALLAPGAPRSAKTTTKTTRKRR